MSAVRSVITSLYVPEDVYNAALKHLQSAEAAQPSAEAVLPFSEDQRAFLLRAFGSKKLLIAVQARRKQYSHSKRQRRSSLSLSGLMTNLLRAHLKLPVSINGVLTADEHAVLLEAEAKLRAYRPPAHLQRGTRPKAVASR